LAADGLDGLGWIDRKFERRTASLKLLDIVNRSPAPEPWAEGDNIPWHDPDFSERMLKEHLSQEHDAASRRFDIIDQHVRWIHHELLLGRPTRVLDLGCGPGLYTSRLARLGHRCVGIDYSPASIAYARAQTSIENLACRYLCEDIRAADYGTGFGLAMLIFGEFNVFRPEDARIILHKANRALAAGGLLLLEPHAFSTIQRMGRLTPSWYTAMGGLFADDPHLCLQESFWDSSTWTATVRYYVIDASSGQVDGHAQSLQAYTDKQYRTVLAESGFGDIEFHHSLTGHKDTDDFFAVVGRKRGTSLESLDTPESD
jgi:SAM-dependent methyltransferase